MSDSILIGLLNNAALLLALGLLYDTLSAKQRGSRPDVLQVITGLILALIGVAVMSNPVKWESGVIFDTRSVLLCVSGLFFGTVPTLIEVVITAGYRLALGGDGARMGVAVITCSGLIGVAWRHLRRREVQDLSLGELYVFGVLVHVVMLICMFLLPKQMIYPTLVKVGLPVLLVYPVGTALLGKLMAGRHARKRAEAALRASEEKYRELVENANSIILRLDRDSNVQFINEYGQKFFGFTEQELLGKSVVGTIVPVRESGGRDLAHLIAEVFREPEKHQQMLNENTCRDARRVWVSWSNRPLRDEAGQVVGMFCVGTDITDRKRAVDLLHENQEKYQQLFELSSDAIILVDNETARLLEVNSAAASLYGYTREELLRLTILGLSAEPETTQQTMGGLRNQHGQPLSIPQRLHRKKDGTVFPVEITGRLFTWQGRSVHIAAIRDISARQQAEQARRLLDRQMQESQKLESLGVLAGGIAHDFNNLLMTILGNADLALNELSPLSPVRANLQEIDKASRRAADLCRQLLAYSGRGRFVVELVSLSEVIQELIQLLRASISKKARLNLNLDPSVARVRGDATQLRQVIMNLVINASEAIGERDGVITIATSMAECTAEDLRSVDSAETPPPGAYVMLEVSDTGCGMDPETQRRIFEPFFSTKFTGRGLGLSAVLGIVRGHKGAISLQSQPGQGTTFRVLLPVANGSSTTPAQPAEAHAETWSAAGTVLLVDDEPSVRQTGQRQLERLGHRVLTAGDGAEAVEVYRQHRPDISIVLLDLTMPRLNGEETLRRLRQLDPAVRVVLCSGYTETDILARYGSLGLAGFLQKPFTLSELRKCLEAAFRPPNEPA